MKLGKTLKELLKNREFNRIVKEGLKSEEILDVILFGSSVKGKENPSDVDLLVLFAKKQNTELIYGMRKEMELFGFKPHLVGAVFGELYDSNFLARESIFTEGFSLKNRKFLHEGFGFSSFVLFRYSLKKFNASERMKFYHSLYGRRGERGVLETFSAFKFSDSVIAVSVENSFHIREFLESKNVEFDEIHSLFPSRLSSKKFLEAK